MAQAYSPSSWCRPTGMHELQRTLAQITEDPGQCYHMLRGEVLVSTVQLSSVQTGRYIEDYTLVGKMHPNVYGGRARRINSMRCPGRAPALPCDRRVSLPQRPRPNSQQPPIRTPPRTRVAGSLGGMPVRSARAAGRRPRRRRAQHLPQAATPAQPSVSSLQPHSRCRAAERAL